MKRWFLALLLACGFLPAAGLAQDSPALWTVRAPGKPGKVTLFGVSSASILYGGGGSGTVDTSTAPTLKEALESAGFQINPTMWSFYTEGAASSIRMDVADIAGTGRYARLG